MKLCWLDIRAADGAKEAIVEEAVHQRVDAIVAADPADLEPLPPTVKKVLFPLGRPLPEKLEPADLVIVDPARHGDPAELALAHAGVEFGRYVEITDAESLEDACRAARHDRWSLLDFRDPTKIPLEIVLAAAAGAEGSIVTRVADVEEAEIVFGVLEHGSDGVMLAPRAPGEATDLKAAAVTQAADLSLVELEVTGIRRVGMGERAAVDLRGARGLVRQPLRVLRVEALREAGGHRRRHVRLGALGDEVVPALLAELGLSLAGRAARRAGLRGLGGLADGGTGVAVAPRARRRDLGGRRRDGAGHADAAHLAPVLGS